MRTICRSIFFITFAFFLEVAGAHGITLSLIPDAQVVGVGDSAQVALRVSDLVDSAAPSLGAFDIDLNFDPTLLSFASASFGDPVLGDQLDVFSLGSVTATTLGSGTINLFQLSLDSEDDLNQLQAGDFILATLSFNAIGSGTSVVGLTVNAFGDAAGQSLNTEVTGGAVTVRAVIPEPSSLLLLLAGLPLVFNLTNRRKSRFF